MAVPHDATSSGRFSLYLVGAGASLRWIAAGALAALVLAAPSRVGAQRCENAARWAEDCTTDEVLVRVRRCFPGGVILSASVPGGVEVDVEIAANKPRAFHQIHGFGVSPVGEFPDWSQAPDGVHRAFAAVGSCLEGDPSLDVPAGRSASRGSWGGDHGPDGGGGGRAEAAPRPPVPWLLLGALLSAAFALLLGYRRTPWSVRDALVWLAPPALAALGAYALRALIGDPSFVHQNGQGPLWVSHALCVTPQYGPGYTEVFGWPAAWVGGEASAAIFTLQAALGALGVASAWLLLRALSVSRALAVVLTVAVAVEPSLIRIAQSESYFAVICSLLLIAGALIATGARRRRPLDAVFLLRVLAAGFLVAQAARIHPVAWLPAATVPLVLSVGRGRLRTRFLSTLVATVGIGLTAAIFAAPVIGAVAGGDVGDQWLPGFLSRVPRGRMMSGLYAGAAGAGLIFLLARNRRRGAVRAGAFFVVVAAAFCSHIIGAVGPIIVTAYLLLFLPPFIAALGAGIEGLFRRRWHRRTAAVVLVVALAAYAVQRADGVLTLPTDATEQRWLLDHSPDLPDGATVAFLGVAGPRRRVHLPFYGECRGEAVLAIQLSADDRPPAMSAFPGAVIWYRSSLCATDEGREYCEAFEASHRLSPLATADLEPRESMDDLGYLLDPVPVGLFAVQAPP